jgi:hypothetical protein
LPRSLVSEKLHSLDTKEKNTANMRPLVIAAAVAAAALVVSLNYALLLRVGGNGTAASSISASSGALQGEIAQLRTELRTAIRASKQLSADLDRRGNDRNGGQNDEQENTQKKMEYSGSSSLPSAHSNGGSGGSGQKALRERDSPKTRRLREKLARYAQIHADIVAKKRPVRLAECVLINGWGNVLQEAVSCFLWGLATDRAVVFNWRGISGYMPFGDWVNGAMEEPQGSKPKHADHARHGQGIRRLYTHMPFDGYNLDLLKPYTMHRVTRHDLQCGNLSMVDNEYVQIHLTYDFFAPYILSNPVLGEIVAEWLPENYFEVIFAYLFRLRPDLEKQVEDFKRQHFGAYTIALQIRSASSRAKNGVVDHRGTPVPPLDLYAQMANQMERFQESVPEPNVVWFVATQDQEALAYLRRAYGAEKIVSVNSTITTTFDKGEDGQRSALVTWWLIGEADDVITTELSSYGTTAAARGGIRSVVCNAHKFCHRRVTATPCQDTKFPVDQPQPCMNKWKSMPHHFMASPEQHCGYFKRELYMTKEWQEAQKKKG